MVTVAIMALELEYLVKILGWGRTRSRYIFPDSDSTALTVALLSNYWLLFLNSTKPVKTFVWNKLAILIHVWLSEQFDKPNFLGPD
jgi:hypothetical protein